MSSSTKPLTSDMSSLFPDDEPASSGDKAPAPLAERMRPRTLDEFVGQEELLGPGRPLREAIERDLLQSIILWGPPGTGKTTLARIIADLTEARFVAFSAVLAGIKEIREVMAEAERLRRATGRRTIVFIDEIHRFNKAQQDAFLPHVEAGDIVLIGATTENPSFEVNAALLSRSKVFVLRGSTPTEIAAILRARDRRSRARPRREPASTSTTRRSAPSRDLRQRRRARGAQPARARASPPRRQSTATRARSTGRASSRRFSGGRCSTTSPARSTTTSSRRSTSRCATAIPTPRSTGWRACSRPARIRSTSRGAWCASRPKTSATPIRRR